MPDQSLIRVSILYKILFVPYILYIESFITNANKNNSIHMNHFLSDIFNNGSKNAKKKKCHLHVHIPGTWHCLIHA